MSYLLNSEAIPLPLQRYLGEPDPRVKNWFLLNTPLGLITIMMLYFTMIKIGTKIMRNRKPINLKNVLIIYNFFQVAFSTYICKEIFMTAYESNYSWLCVHLSPKVNTQTMRMATAFWYFYLSKVIDLADTMFFVLRKKTAQLTILHCYHHGSMVFNWYLGVLYLPGGQAFFSVLVNSFVHAIMYTYYLLSAFGPQMQKHLWWKKYLTQIQLHFVAEITDVNITYIPFVLFICVHLHKSSRALRWVVENQNENHRLKEKQLNLWINNSIALFVITKNLVMLKWIKDEIQLE